VSNEPKSHKRHPVYRKTDNKTEIDYTLTNGLNVVTYDLNDQSQHRWHEAKTGSEQHDCRRIRSWLENVGGIPVRLTLFGTDESSDKLVVHFDDWARKNSLDNINAHVTIDPKSHHLLVGQMGRDGAGVLPREALLAFSKSGSFKSYGKVYAAAIEELVTQYKHVTVQGTSIGGRFAISVVANLSESIDRLQILDAPGDHYMSVPKFIRNFDFKEGKQSIKYSSNNPSELSIFRKVTTIFHRLRSGKDEPNTTKERLWYQGHASRKDRLFGDLAMALQNVKCVDVVTLEHSALTDNTILRRNLGKFALESRCKNKITLSVIKNHTHAAIGTYRPQIEPIIFSHLKDDR